MALSSSARAQGIRQVPLNTATGTIDRPYLPASQTFDFLVRAASELREMHAEYRSPQDAEAIVAAPWTRLGGTQSRDATVRVAGLRPGVTYQFRFVFVRRPNGNEGRLIEAGVADALRDAFRARPAEPLDSAAALAGPRVKAALDSAMPRAVPVPASPLTGVPPMVVAALQGRGVDVLHADYRRQLGLVYIVRARYRLARADLARAPLLARVIDRLGGQVRRRGDVSELEAPLAACRLVRDSLAQSGPDSLQTDQDHLDLLRALKAYDAALGSCRSLLRDIRLPRYAAVRVPSAAEASDLLGPVAGRLDVVRSETEQLVLLWRKRDGALSQVAGDIRRGLDTRVSVSDTLRVALTSAPRLEVPPRSTLGIGLAATWAPCSVTDSCIRIVPTLGLSFRLQGLVGADVGFTLADTDAPGRTRHLFWFTSAMTGVSVRLGAARSQRLGAGALILRRAEGSDFDSFHVGGYVNFTVYDLRL